VTDHNDFVERRRHRVGASDVAAALTGSFGLSPAAVIGGKLGLLADQPTDRMRLGLALEDKVIDAAAVLLGVTVEARQVEVPHPDYPWLVATCDALVRPATGWRFPLEVKTTSNPDGYPEEYLETQLTAQMLCLGVTKGFSAVRNLATGEFTVREHRLDDDVAEMVLGMAKTLWEYLDTGTLPPAMFPGDSQLWNRLHPQSTGTHVELDADLFEELVVAKEDAQQYANIYDLLEAKVKEQLGEAEIGTVDGVPRIRWRTYTQRRIDLKSLEAENPDLVEAHRKESSARRFGVVAPIRQHTNAKEQ
jgi:predicted phage-related endonuclease